MNESSNEQLSALIDGEHDNSTVLNNLINDEDMRGAWQRYHLIGDCLRGHLPDTLNSDISTKVSKELREEPTVLAPQTSKRFNLKPIAGFAIAASVALVAVFTIQRSAEIDTSNGTIPAVASNEVNKTYSQPQSYTFPEPQVLPASIKKSDTPESIANQRLNNYLMNYNEYRSNGGMNGILPYVRIVTIESQE
jgi:sigma-E factor negative regulatory protein RseA